MGERARTNAYSDSRTYRVCPRRRCRAIAQGRLRCTHQQAREEARHPRSYSRCGAAQGDTMRHIATERNDLRPGLTQALPAPDQPYRIATDEILRDDESWWYHNFTL